LRVVAVALLTLNPDWAHLLGGADMRAARGFVLVSKTDINALPLCGMFA